MLIRAYRWQCLPLILQTLVSMATDSCIAETCLKHCQVTRVRPGLPSVLTGTTEHQTTTLNWKMPTMHAATLVVRPLTVLGATLQIAKYDGSTVSLKSAMTALNIEGDRARAGVPSEKKLGLVKVVKSQYSTVFIQQYHLRTLVWTLVVG